VPHSERLEPDEHAAPDVVDADLAVLEATESAGLRYVTDREPGLRRVRSGRGFRYVTSTGAPARPSDAARAKALVIPPAWTEVWVCRDADGHLQATGRDAKGRKQYRYHDRWRSVRDADKFDRLPAFGAALPKVRATVAEHLSSSGLPRERVLALVVRLLDETLIRVGNEEYATENETFGLTTLRDDHVRVRGSTVTFEFVGKSGREQEVAVADRRLAGIVRRCHELGGKALFTYRDDDDRPACIDSGDVNRYLRALAGPDTSAKDFRTWGGTVLAAEHLVEAAEADGAAQSGDADRDLDGEIVAAIDHAAEALGNTRAVCRQSYVHPAVLDAHRSGELLDAWRHSRSSDRMRRGERAVLRVLAG
jgi:DNA topoisomerase-1